MSYYFINDNLNKKHIQISEITKDIKTFDNNASTLVTSRGSSTRNYIHSCTLYKIMASPSECIYVSTQEKAESIKNEIIPKIEGVDINISTVVVYAQDFSSNEEEINNFKTNIINKYKIKPKKENIKKTDNYVSLSNDSTCFPGVSKTINCPYGYRSSGFHTGIDLGGSYGDNVYAYKSGTIIKVQHSNSSYGNMILIEHGNGMQSRYAHLSSTNVNVGDKVNAGSIIGFEGSTGNSTGVHLHFEIIINGNTVNPYNYIF